MSELLIPVQTEQTTNNIFSFPEPCTITAVIAEDQTGARQLTERLRTLGVTARMDNASPHPTIVLRRNRSISHPEGYHLTIEAEHIEIQGATGAGVFYGVQTLLDLIRSEGQELQCRQIKDWPALSRRGVYHDCSRGKVPTVETVKRLVEWLAHWKINELQLYIENVFTFAGHPRIGEGYSPYSPRDLLDIQEHCNHYHVRFVPSLASFGHFEKILMLPEYQDLGEMPGFRDLPGGTTLCPLDERSGELIKDLYDEFLPIFGAEDFNACGDEPWELGRGRTKEQENAGQGKSILSL